MIEFDGEIVFVYQFLRFNPYTNANHAKGSYKEIAEFEQSSLYALLYDEVKTHCEDYSEHFKEPQIAYRKPIESLSKGFQEPIDSGYINEEKPIERVSTPRPIPRPNTKTNKERGFTPPTLADVEAYCQGKNLAVDAKRFHEFFTEGDWIDTRGKPVRNWKQKLLTWDNHADKSRASQPIASTEKDYTEGETLWRP